MARSTRQAVATDRLDDMLTRLKLPALRDQLDTLLDEATRHDLSMRETLALLCEREIARKDQRRSMPNRSAILLPPAGSPMARTCCQDF
jgi:hypothetical protein